MKVTVHVRREDLKGSRYISNKDCPIARALRREFPTANISVGSVGFYFDTDRSSMRTDWHYSFPEKLQAEQYNLMEFNRHKFRPFYFRFELPERLEHLHVSKLNKETR